VVKVVVPLVFSVHRWLQIQLLVMFINIFDNNFDCDIIYQDLNILRKFHILNTIYQLSSTDNQLKVFKMSGKEATSAPEKKKKESILDLTRLVDNK